MGIEDYWQGVVGPATKCYFQLSWQFAYYYLIIMREELQNVGGVKCHAPMSRNAIIQPHAPKILDAWCETKKFCAEDKNDPEKTIFFRYIDCGIIISVFGTQVQFKRARNQRFKDCRDGKTYSRDETLAELTRMLADSYEAERAMTMLEFG